MLLEGFTPWPEEFARLYRAKGYWEDVTLPALFARMAADEPEREAIADCERRLTMRELWDESSRLAAHFLRLGLQMHERVVFQLPNCVDFLTTFLALSRVGAIPVLALPPHRETEIIHFARSSGATALFIPHRLKDFDYRTMAEAVQVSVPGLKKVFVLGPALSNQISLRELAAAPVTGEELAAVERVPLDPNDVALMLLSGGTTALPKLIPRTHNDYICNFKLSAKVSGVDAQTVYLAVLPIAHNYTWSSPGVLGVLAGGGRVVISPKTDCATVFDLVEREGVTLIAAAVPLVVMWLNDPALSGFNTSSLRLVQNGGARLSPELRDRLRKRLGCQFQEVYGTAEGLINMTRLDDPDDKILETSGRPNCEDDEIKVLDLDDREVPDGTPGELVTRGPYTIRGYYNAPEVNAKAFTPDGFYRMGDVVRKYGRYLVTEGRKKDLINRGGEKISSDEVENFILKHPAVKGVVIVAMPDDVFGEKACAFVTLNSDTPLTLKELQEFLLAQKIAKFKLPERLEILKEFPLSPAGKILRRTLREMISAKIAEEKQNPGAVGASSAS
jgi:2,3-dihydroxybenzoate-AMP ligase